MDYFDILIAPDLDQAEVIESEKFTYLKYAHIEYFIKSDGSYIRVCRPFGEWPPFYVPIKSLESEYAKDLEIIKKNQRAMFPNYNFLCDPDEAGDNDWMNEHCFTQVKEEA